MEIGSLVTTTFIKHMSEGVSLDWKAAKGKYFVFVLLGHTNKDGSDPLDVTKRMNELGWYRKETS